MIARLAPFRLIIVAIVAGVTAGCAAHSPRSLQSALAVPSGVPAASSAPSPEASASPETPAPPHHTKLYWPHGAEWGQATMKALRSERTWIPAVAALAVAPWDRKVSDWATTHTPVFGSVDSAQKASGDLVGLTELSMIVTALVEPGGDAPLRSRLNRLLVEYAATSTANLTTSGIKNSVTRTRPDGDGQDSFPSGHSTRAFASATMSSANLAATPMPNGLRIGLDAGITTLAAGTAWARVEGGRHFPSDVLAGAAIGSFVSTWVRECFLREPSLSVDVSAGRREWAIDARWAF